MPPLVVFALPPLLLLYPLSYVLMVARSLLPERAKALLVRTGGVLRPASLETSDPTAAGSVQRIGGTSLPFCEDVVLFPPANVAIFSSDPDRDVYNPFANTGDPALAGNGRLMALPLPLAPSASNSAQAYEITIEKWPPNRPLHPLGINVTRDHSILAVANVTASFAAVEVLRLSTTHGRVVAEYVHSMEHAALGTPNAVVPLSAECVLVTNSFAYAAQRSRVLNKLETFLAIPGSSVLALSKPLSSDSSGPATQCRVISRGLALANGLALSDDGAVLLAAGCVSSNIHVYDVVPPIPASGPVDIAAFAFACRESIPAGYMVDNLRYVEEGGHEHTFVACGHPSGLDFAATAARRGAAPLSGTRAVSVRVPKTGTRAGRVGTWLNGMFTRVDERVRVVFEDDGRVLGSGATAVVVDEGGRRDLIVTGLFDRRGPVRVAGVEL